jgi:hypothetical protein
MTDWTLDGRLGTQITVDVCTDCQAFWFDQHKSLQLSPGSTLKLMKFIGRTLVNGQGNPVGRALVSAMRRPVVASARSGPKHAVQLLGMCK